MKYELGLIVGLAISGCSDSRELVLGIERRDHIQCVAELDGQYLVEERLNTEKQEQLSELQKQFYLEVKEKQYYESQTNHDRQGRTEIKKRIEGIISQRNNLLEDSNIKARWNYSDSYHTSCGGKHISFFYTDSRPIINQLLD
ncbi:hypothetical protein HN385_00125 [archaeon]|jgi:hypothetical protein|nr:hypothetical protein [archaeon]MBT3451239.1 hypothetical protein [archaeon]MBT6869032.1 hypothetical protein [archaeon]MBT7193620.1 hypothetical protein [archaeon]MBT7380153.1 hypothetical protein [archaeon]